MADERDTLDRRELEKRLREAEADRDRYRWALWVIASEVGHPGDPAWVEAMEALGLDVEAAIDAWHD